VKEKTTHIFIYIFLGLFVFNHVAELMQHENKELAAYCCELEETEEFSELENRLKAFSPSEIILLTFHTDFFCDLLPKLNGVSTRSVQRAFFPHALHVPIYLDKGVLIV
jgi:hypothetical protein